MPQRTSIARLTDIVEAIEVLAAEMDGVTLHAFEADRRKRWLVECGIEIISEASRHLPDDLKGRQSTCPGSRSPASAISSGTTTSGSPTIFFGMSCASTCRSSIASGVRSWLPSRRPSSILDGTRDELLRGWLAYALPCQRFTGILAGICACLGADAVRYAFHHGGSHPLLLCRSPSAPNYNVLPTRKPTAVSRPPGEYW